MGQSIVRGHAEGARATASAGRRRPVRRLRGELAVTRDVALYRELCSGRSVSEVALLFRLHRRSVYRRLEAMPLRAKRAVEAELRSEGLLRRSIVRELIERARKAEESDDE